MNKLQRPAKTLGLRHVALFVSNLEACVDFYTRLIGMSIEWQPDPDNVYLTNGNDNLALHRWQGEVQPKAQALDHIGFILPDMQSVDEWHAFLQAEGVVIKKAPKVHRDGAMSFYCVRSCRYFGADDLSSADC
jgi:catechol 2,3-dioxygenase-like lactoylglutathione lyase family enzyme